MMPQFPGSSLSGLRLDPRSKIYLLVVFGIVMIDGKTDGICSVLKPALALLPFFLLFLSRRKRAAAAYLAIFVLSWIINRNLVPHMGGAAVLAVSLVTQLGMRWFPGAMMGYYLLTTTKVSEFVLAMQKMHVPEAVTIPFSVMFRFFPTVMEEAEAIGNAMRMRGIAGRNFLKNPQAYLEYRLVPLMMSVVTIGNDLSAAAVTRGLGNGKERTSLCAIGFHLTDAFFLLPATAALLLFFFFPGGV